MPHHNPVNWQALDWHRTTQEIAKEVKRSTNTVSKARLKYAPETSGKHLTRTRQFTPASKHRQLIQCSKNGIKNQPAATAAAKESPKAGRGQTNHRSQEWCIISPAGEVFEIKNLYQFVRENPDLFLPKDTIWKRTGGGRGTGGEWCNATAGLLNIKSNKSKAWKGWNLEI